MEKTVDPEPLPEGEMFGGPYLATAVICESITMPEDLTSQDIHRVQNSFSGVDHNVVKKVSVLQKLLHLSFNAGDFSGSLLLRIRIVAPDGSQISDYGRVLEFEPFDVMITATEGLVLPMAQQGWHWVEVRLGDRLMTKVPFRVTFLQPKPPLGLH